MAGKIFINYRRDDSISTAGRLHDRLAQTFGRKNLFMDVDHVPAGVDFVDYLHKQVAACDVFLAVIGPNWVDAKDDSGRRRFDNPNDYVTVEIGAALARNIRVIPVLVDGARTPNADKLPDSIKPLVRRNAVEVRNTNFGRDADALTDKVREALKSARPVTRRLPFMASAAAWLMVPGRWRRLALSATALILAWIGLYQIGVPVWVPWTQKAEQPDPVGAEKSNAAAEAETQRKAAEAEQQRLAAAKAEEEREAKAAAEAEAKRKADEAERQRLAAAKAEEERKAKASAEAEAQRKAEEAEQQRLAAAKADEERKAKAAAEVEARRKSDTFYNRGTDYAGKGDMDRAIADLSEAIRLDPNNADAFANRGFAYAAKGDMDRAIADYNEAIRLDPKKATVFHNRGSDYAKKGDMDRAIADYNEAIRLDPNFADAFVKRGFAYAAKGDMDRAIADYNESIRLDWRASTFYNRGNAYGKKGDWDRAIADYNEAIRLDPNHLAFGNRGVAYANKGDWNRAIADYNEAIRLDPKYALALCNRGVAKLKINEASGNADIAKARELDASICR